MISQTSKNVTPRSIFDNTLDGWLRDSKNLTKPFLSVASVAINESYQPDGLRGKYSLGVIFTFKVITPTFTRHILDIIHRCSDKQMVWIAADRIVALVASNLAFWYWAICNSPSNPMGHPGIFL